MKTRSYGVRMDQGADFNITIGLRDVNGPLDLTGYAFKSDMRLSTDPNAPIAGGQKAMGTITFTAQPAPLDTITINGVVITFVAAAPVGPQVLIDTTLALTISNLLTFLKASVNPSIILATYGYPDPCNPGLVLNVTAVAVGVVGNAFTLVVTSASITVSGATLLGGINAASFIFTILDQVANKGKVQMSLPSTIIATIAASVSNDLQTMRLKTPFVFDVKMKDTINTVSRIVEGIIYLSPQATQGVIP